MERNVVENEIVEEILKEFKVSKKEVLKLMEISISFGDDIKIAKENIINFYKI